MNTWRPDTLAVRGGLARSAFDETSEGLFLTSGYVYSSAQEAEAAFKDEIDRFVGLEDVRDLVDDLDHALA